MNGLLLAFSLGVVVAQMILPRRWAFVPILIAACHAPYNVSFGGDLTALRLVLLVGLLRAGLTGLIDWSPRKPIDLAMAFWSIAALVSAAGHNAENALWYRCGLVFNVLGAYLYSRAYLRSLGDLKRMTQALAIVLAPLALFLVMEAVTGSNAYHAMGSRAASLVREERNRAMGPFGTPILAGTLGAICFPLFLLLWSNSRLLSKVGIGSSLTIIVTSASSGPIGTLLIGIGSLLLWRWRKSLGKVKLAVVALLFVIQLFRERSVWYLISLIDFVGGSTGWYRSRLLDSASTHIGEWWLWGTEYTRHWMPTGLRTNPNHCDLTSYYVHLGVIGGLPLLLSLIWIIWKSFSMLGRRMRQLRAAKAPEEFLLWCLGCALFAHTITFFTVSYFDQLYVFFYTLAGAITMVITTTASAAAPTPTPPPMAAEPVSEPNYAAPV